MSHTAAVISTILFRIPKQLVYKHLIVRSSSLRKPRHFTVSTDEETELSWAEEEKLSNFIETLVN